MSDLQAIRERIQRDYPTTAEFYEYWLGQAPADAIALLAEVDRLRGLLRKYIAHERPPGDAL